MVTRKKVGRYWVPADCTHFDGWLRKGAGYQEHKRRAALRYVTKFRTAVDAGAHVGLWAIPLAGRFDRVAAFEPMPVHFECLVENAHEHRVTDRIDLYPWALGSRHVAHAWMRKGREGNSGTANLDLAEGEVVTEVFPLDSFNLHDVDLLKIDVEASSLDVVKGASGLIKRERPVIVIEDHTGHAVKMLVDVGYRRVQKFGHDHVLVP